MSEPTLIKGRRPDADPVIKLTSEQILVIDRELYTKLMHYINAAGDKECMWYSCVQRVSDVDAEVLVYQIYDLFIPHQTVADKEVEATGAQMSDMWMEIKTDRGLSLKELGELSKYACLWGHSHVTMPPKPSPQDEKQWKEWKGTCLAPDLKTQEIPLKVVGMIILNQKEDYTNRILDPEIGAEFHNIPMYIRDPIDYEYINRAVKDKLHKKEPPKTTSGTGSSSWQGGHGTGTGSTSSTTGKAVHTWTGGTTSSPTPQAQASQVKEATTQQVKSTQTGSTGTAGTSSLTQVQQKSIFTVRGKIPRYWAVPGLETAIQNLEDTCSRFWGITNRDEMCSKIEEINRIEVGNAPRLNAECTSLVRYIHDVSIRPATGDKLIMNDWMHRVGVAIKILNVIGEHFKVSTDKREVLEHVKIGLENYVGTLTDITEYFQYEVVFVEQVFVFALAISVIIDQIDHQTEEGRRMNTTAVNLIKDLILVFEHASKV